MKLSHSAVLAFAASAMATTSCSSSSHCPEDLPCCNLYGECGTGSYCIGPCNPQFSYNISACAPAPICESGSYTFTNQSGIAKNTKYLGDASSYNFVVNNDIVTYDESLLLTMANQSTGTVLTSTRAIWYGKVSATFKTSRTQGVVSSMILMSGVRDEIDFEFIGSYLEDAQTNYYWQEVLDYDNEQNITLSNTFENYHTYTVDWTEESITWEVDGQTGRTLNKSSTYNSTTGVYDYPQTPAFLQISIWPGGLSTNAEGTIAWAGGEIDWDSADIQDPGYFYVTLKDVTIECYDAPSNTTTTGSNAYVYTSTDGLSTDVKITNDTTIMGSSDAVGWDMDEGSDDDLATVTGTASSTSSSSTGTLADASAESTSSSTTGTLANASEETSSTTSKKSSSSSKTASGSESSDSSASSGTASSDGTSSATATSTSTSAAGFEQSSTTTSAESSNNGHKLVAATFGGACVALFASLMIVA